MNCGVKAMTSNAWHWQHCEVNLSPSKMVDFTSKNGGFHQQNSPAKMVISPAKMKILPAKMLI
jgi:hypothetical protein